MVCIKRSDKKRIKKYVSIVLFFMQFYYAFICIHSFIHVHLHYMFYLDTLYLGLDVNIDESERINLRNSAIAAVDAAENNLRIKSSKTENSSVGGSNEQGQIGGIGIGSDTRLIAGGGGVQSTSSTSMNVLVSQDTELASQLLDYPELTKGPKLVTLQVASTASTSLLSSNSTSSGGIQSLSGLLIRPTPPTTEIYSELGLQAIQRILESFNEIKKIGAKVIVCYIYYFCCPLYLYVFFVYICMCV